MDRTHLVEATLYTVSHTLSFGILLVIGVLIIFLGSPKGALIATITIPISLLIAFILMWLTNIPANLLSLGAIDFGIIVHGTVVMMETILKKREDNPEAPLDENTIAQRIAEVAKPIFFATLIIIVYNRATYRRSSETDFLCNAYYHCRLSAAVCFQQRRETAVYADGFYVGLCVVRRAIGCIAAYSRIDFCSIPKAAKGLS